MQLAGLNAEAIAANIDIEFLLSELIGSGQLCGIRDSNYQIKVIWTTLLYQPLNLCDLGWRACLKAKSIDHRGLTKSLIKLR